MSGSEARELVEALALTAASLDPSPHQNITDGCIRVPGSASTSLAATRYSSLPCPRPTTSCAAATHADAIAALRPRWRRSCAGRPRTRSTHGPRRRPAATAHILFLRARVGGSETPAAPSGPYRPVRHRKVQEPFRGPHGRPEPLQRLRLDPATRSRTSSPASSPASPPYMAQLRSRNGSSSTEWAKAGTPGSKNARTPQSTGKKMHLLTTQAPQNPQGGQANRSTAAIHQLVNDLENVLYAVLDHRLQRPRPRRPQPSSS